MTAKATPVTVPTPGAFLGKFRIRRFDISDNRDARDYEELRTKANERNSGITIENIRDLVETTVTTDPDRNRMQQDRWYVVVSWWEKDKVDKPDKPELSQTFYAEKEVPRIGEPK